MDICSKIADSKMHFCLAYTTKRAVEISLNSFSTAEKKLSTRAVITCVCVGYTVRVDG